MLIVMVMLKMNHDDADERQNDQGTIIPTGRTRSTMAVLIAVITLVYD